MARRMRGCVRTRGPIYEIAPGTVIIGNGIFLQMPAAHERDRSCSWGRKSNMKDSNSAFDLKTIFIRIQACINTGEFSLIIVYIGRWPIPLYEWDYPVYGSTLV